MKAAWLHEVELLPSPNGVGGADSDLGRSVSIHGNRALVGAPGAASNGVAIILDFDGTKWIETQIIMPDDGAAGDYFGVSVSLSGDRALVGAFGHDGIVIDSGSVFVFEFSGTSWNQSAKISAADGATDDFFGYSVSLSGDQVLVGAHWDDDNGTNSGSAYVVNADRIFGSGFEG